MNRINPYERGWLTMLVKAGICTEEQAREAQNRVAQAALDEFDRLREARRQERREERRRKRREEG